MINYTHDKEAKRLIITADNESRAELAECARGSFRSMDDYVQESLHECFDLMSADDTPEAWCISAPFMIESDCIDYADNGQRIVRESARMFTYSDYVFSNPWELLKDKGRVVWEQVKLEYPPAPSIETLKSYLPGGANEGQLVWFGETTFPGANYHDVLKAWPELARNSYEPESWDCGLYFWKEGKRHGPFSNSPRGYLDADKEGAVQLKWDCDYTPENKQGLLAYA